MSDSDAAYLQQRLAYMRANSAAANSEEVVGYGRIMPKNVDQHGRLLSNTMSGLPGPGQQAGINQMSQARSLQSSSIGQRVGAIESLVSDGAGATVPTDYKLYDRSNIIVSSKFATPKQVETLAKDPNSHQDVKYQGSSPTPSIGSSGRGSQHSSPRTSVATMGQQPLYENLETYGRSVPAYYHRASSSSGDSSPRASLAEMEMRRAQPQVPIGRSSGRDFPPYEAPPVYENIQDVLKPSNYEPARPGPQVAVQICAAPVIATGITISEPQSSLPGAMRQHATSPQLPPPPPYPGSQRPSPAVNNSSHGYFRATPMQQNNGGEYVIMKPTTSQAAPQQPKPAAIVPQPQPPAVQTSPVHQVPVQHSPPQINPAPVRQFTTQPKPAPIVKQFTSQPTSKTAQLRLKPAPGGKNLLPFIVTSHRPVVSFNIHNMYPLDFQIHLHTE
jgi:hypothetical protein